MAVKPSPAYLAENSSAPLYQTAVTFMVLQSIFVVLFYASRYINKTAYGVDFWCFIPLAYVFCMANCSISIVGIQHGGTGRHTAALAMENPHAIIIYYQLLKAQEFVQQAAVLTPKLAILVLYSQIFTTRPYRLALYVTACAAIATCAGAFITSLAICQPFAFNWDKSIHGGKCGDVLGFYKGICIPNLVTDFVILVLPMPALLKLKVNIIVKIGLIITFLTGSLGIITSIIRTVMFFRDERLTVDRTYTNVHLFIWTVIEPGAYFLAACMPSLKPLKRWILQHTGLSAWIGTNLSSRGSKGGLSKNTIGGSAGWKGSRSRGGVESATYGSSGVRGAHYARKEGYLETSSVQDLTMRGEDERVFEEHDSVEMVQYPKYVNPV